MKCEDCRFWQYTQLNGDEEKVGICRKNAPIGKLAKSTDYCYEWPRTDYDNWCGEFQEKDK